MVNIKRSAHFIGIGGIGVSALARYYLSRGWRVSGSDAASSSLTESLEKEGVKVFIGHHASHVKSPDLVVYTVIIPPENPERRQAEKLGIKTLSYAEALGELSREYFTVAVTGSHGKSTVASILALILIKAGLDPTVIVGTKLKEFGGKNFRKGRSRYLVLEADDFNRSFLHLSPTIAVITNVDREHLDIYKNYAGVLKGFKDFTKKISADGFLVVNAADQGAVKSAQNCPAKVVWYNHRRFKSWPLKVPGRYNQENAEAAATAARLLGVKEKTTSSALQNYRGVWRRLEIITPRQRKINGVIVTDYAHHPTEITATLSALHSAYPKKKLTVIFQPHQQDRFNRLFDEFKKPLRQADAIALLPVYRVKGRNASVKKTSKQLAENLKLEQIEAHYLRDFSEIPAFLEKTKARENLYAFLSAGDLDSWLRKYFGVK